MAAGLGVRMTRRKGVLLFALVLSAVAVYCADLTGKWQWEAMASGGRTQYTLTLKQDGESLAGTLASGEDVTPIREGKATGDKLSFVVARTWGKRETTMTY